jgi:hypothetical protein
MKLMGHSFSHRDLLACSFAFCIFVCFCTLFFSLDTEAGWDKFSLKAVRMNDDDDDDDDEEEGDSDKEESDDGENDDGMS